jgi:hypothetical protein
MNWGSRRWGELGGGALAAALIAGAALTLAGCGDSAPTGGASSGGNNSGGSPGAFEVSACGTCLLEACGNAVTTCEGTPECASYLGCLLECPLDAFGNADAGCDAGCVPMGESSAGQAGRITLTSCRIDGPGADCEACGAEETPPQDCDGSVQETPCLQCYANECCETRAACYEGNPDCEALAACVAPCVSETYTEPCIAECFAEYPAVAQTWVSERQCALMECANEVTTCDASLRHACTACKYETCGASLEALIATEGGYLTWVCALDCSYLQADAQCYKDCTDKYPEHLDEFSLWGECLGFQCQSVCAE